MDITEVRIKLIDDNSGANERLLGFSSITFDNRFVVRDLKVIEGSRGQFVAMPSRKLMDRCPHCGTKNHLRARFCNQCGSALAAARAQQRPDGRFKLYADIAHPICQSFRNQLSNDVLFAYDEELRLSQLPGYVSRYDDFDNGDDHTPQTYDPDGGR